jgi:hypothetical protein
MDVEVLRSGFLADGRFFSIEVMSVGFRWEARLACVPGEFTRTLKISSSKQELNHWAEGLSLEEIEELARQDRGPPEPDDPS